MQFEYKEGQIYETRAGGDYGRRKVVSVLDDGKCFTYSITPKGEIVANTCDLHFSDGECEGYKGGDLIKLLDV